MDQTWSDSSQVFAHQHCIFPTILRASGKTLSYKTVKIFDHDGLPDQGSRGERISGKDLLPIWAILLRFYAVSDIVAFFSIAAIPDDSPKDVTKGAESKAISQYLKIYMCYDIPDNIRFCDVEVASKTCHKFGDQDATVNTAVAFSNTLSDTAELASVMGDLVERPVCWDLFQLFLI